MAEKQGGYYYCCTCKREYLHPWDKDKHEEHKTYETGQAKRFSKKLHLMSEATRLLQIAKTLRIEENSLVKTVESHLKDVEKKALKLVEEHQSKPKYLRIGSWNLENLSTRHDDRIKSICKTILYHQFNIIALQEACTEGVLARLQELLNARSHKRWDRTTHRVSKTEFLAIFYDNGYSLVEPILPQEDNVDLIRSPISRTFNVAERKKLVIINIHLAYQRGINESEVQELQTILESHLDKRYVILLGDFNTSYQKIKDTLRRFSTEIRQDYCIEPVISDATNVAGTHTYDNVILSTAAKRKLKHSLVGCIVPEGDMTIRKVSNHLPIFVDLDII